MINQVKHVSKDGRELYVNIRISPTEFPGQKALLVTTSDITKRLEAEQQLIQGSKMATLGEMATGVAHELNQPLSVIKTASSFCMKKISKSEPIRGKDPLFACWKRWTAMWTARPRSSTTSACSPAKTDLKLTPLQIERGSGKRL